MGAIVGAILTTHVPRLMILGADTRRAYMGDRATTFYEAMPQLERERLAALAFDTFVVFDTHWFTTTEYVLNAAERLAGVYTSEELPAMFHDYAYDYAGDPELADAVVAAARVAGVRVTAARWRGMAVHYPTLIPMHYFNPVRRRGVLSVGVCQTAGVHNDLAFGRAVGAAVTATDRRVVLVAAGGLSHRFWPYDTILEHAAPDPAEISTQEARAWDERVMALFRDGDHKAVIDLAEEYRRRCVPEGRFAHYLMMIGALGAEAFTSPGVQYGAYESAVGTGQAIFWFDVPAPGRA